MSSMVVGVALEVGNFTVEFFLSIIVFYKFSGFFFFFFFCIGKFHKEKIQLKLTATKNYCQKMAALIKVVDSS